MVPATTLEWTLQIPALTLILEKPNELHIYSSINWERFYIFIQREETSTVYQNPYTSELRCHSIALQRGPSHQFRATSLPTVLHQ